MLVYKFGGASVKDVAGVKNVAEIIRMANQPLVVVVSAMGKMTNALEVLVEKFVNREDTAHVLDEIKQYHLQIIDGLWGTRSSPFLDNFYTYFSKLENKLKHTPSLNYDYDYDRIVSYGELLSTSIVSAWLTQTGFNNQWIDAREILRTSNDFREGRILWELSEKLVKEKITFGNCNTYITQGFIGSTVNNQTTTLGREGSDYTAATFGHLLDAESVTVWKDVPGVYNADPRWFPNPELIPEMSFREAIELAFYGATVLHPKTMKPLQNKRIPLFIKSFVEPSLPGTRVHNEVPMQKVLPIFIRKQNQALVSIAPLDFSFIVENNLRDIFDIFTEHRVKVNLMQNSAMSFSVAINYDQRRFEPMMDLLKQKYKVTYNLDAELLTIRHYTPEVVQQYTGHCHILVEQRSRNTANFLYKNE